MTTQKTPLRFLALLALAAVLSAGCSSVPSPTATLAPEIRPTATTAPTAPEATPTPSLLTGPFTEADLVCSIDGVSATLLSDAAPVLAELGGGFVKTEAVSCLFEGMDKTFDYGFLQVFTIPKGEQDLLDGIYLVDDRFSTARGIRVGDSVSAVVDAYGAQDGEGLLVYNLSGNPEDPTSPSLSFVLDGDTVTAISFYSASNAQGVGCVTG